MSHFRSSRRLAVLLCTTALVTAASIPSSFAGSLDWVGTTTDWQVSTNWKLSGTNQLSNAVPTMNDTVIINTTSPSPTILANGTGTTGALLVGTTGSGTLTLDTGVGLTSYASSSIGDQASGTGVVTVRGSTSWLLSGLALLEIGKYGNGTLHVSNGALVNGTNVLIGSQAGSTGLVTVDGVNSKLLASGTLTVGNNSTGTLNLTNGGQALAGNAAVVGYGAGVTGTVTVDGDKSWFSGNAVTVGSSGKGTVTVTNKGTLGAGLYLGLGYASGASGTVTISGAGSKVQVGSGGTGNVFIGDQGGTGTLDLQSGASGVVSGNVTLGNTVHADGTMNVSGSGTTLAINSVAGSGGGLNIGYLGKGTATVSNAASVTADNIVVGSQSSSQNTLSIESGATVTANKAVDIASSAGSIGTVTVSGTGSSLTVASGGDLTVGDAGTGTLNVLAGGQVTANRHAFVGNQAGGNGAVTVDGAGSLMTLGNVSYIGFNSTGSLTLSNGGQVNAQQNLNLGSGANGNITVTGAGS